MNVFMRLPRPSLAPFRYGVSNAVALFLLLPTVAYAQQYGAIVRTSNGTLAGANGKGQQYTDGSGLGTISATLSTELESFGQFTNAYAHSETSAAATQGRLQGFCRTYAAYGGTNTASETAGSSAIVTADWQDSVTITSNFLPKGYPVQLDMIMRLDGSITEFPYAGSPQNVGRVDAYFQQYDPGHNNVFTYFNYLDSAPSSETKRLTFPTFVGDTVILRGSLYLNAYSSGNYTYNLPSGITLDYGHTSTFFIDPVNTGINLVSDSGHDYASPSVSDVPEPGAVAFASVMGVALCGLIARRRITRA